MATWPATLPQCPLIENYNESPQNSKLESLPDAGAAKVRQRFTASPTNVTENYLLTKSQANTFITFYDTTLKGGTQTFTKHHHTSDTDKTYRIAPGSVYELSSNGTLYSLALELQIMP